MDGLFKKFNAATQEILQQMDSHSASVPESNEDADAFEALSEERGPMTEMLLDE